MAYFEWGDDMVIDNGPIDEDHRKMIDLVNELHTATSAGKGKTVVSRIISELIQQTKAHLVREEQEMERVGFPTLAHHRQEHVEFMDGLYDLVDKQSKGSLTVASQLSTLLRDWLSIHIRRSDHALRLHIKTINRNQPKR